MKLHINNISICQYRSYLLCGYVLFDRTGRILYSFSLCIKTKVDPRFKKSWYIMYNKTVFFWIFYRWYLNTLHILRCQRGRVWRYPWTCYSYAAPWSRSSPPRPARSPCPASYSPEASLSLSLPVSSDLSRSVSETPHVILYTKSNFD